MCMMKTPKMPKPAPIAAFDNQQAIQSADLEASLRRRRAGAAANVLTGAGGIPSTATLGGIAQ